MRFRVLLGAVVWLFFPGISSARPCDKVLAQDELVECLGTEFLTADNQLNDTYNKLRARLDKDARETLKKAQQAWLTYRDGDCEFQASAAAGGQAYNPIYISCQTKKTILRTQELKASGW